MNKRDVQAWAVVDETKESTNPLRGAYCICATSTSTSITSSTSSTSRVRKKVKGIVRLRARKHHADLKQRLGSPGRRKRKGWRKAEGKPPALAPISQPESRNQSSRRDPGTKTSEISGAVPQEERNQLGTIANSGGQGGQGIQAAHAVPDAEVARLVAEAVQLDSDSSGSCRGSADSDAITFSDWDFGGQRVFHSLHHAFLSRYGCYLVVFRMTEMRDNPSECARYVRNWLRSISLHASCERPR